MSVTKLRVNQVTQLTGLNVSNTPAGGISATTVQAAINELDTEKLNLSGGTLSGSLTLPGLTTTASTSGGTVSQTISNTSNTSSSYSAQFIQVAGTTADDPYTQWSISGTRFYAMGIDNSDSDKVKLTTNTSACTPSSGTTLITVDSSGNQIVAGDLAVNGGDITTSQTTAGVFDTTATTVNAFRASTTLNMGYTGTSASTTNIATGAVATATTKTINIGSGGGAGDTLINIGSTQGNSLTYTYGTCIVGNNGTGYVPTAQSLAGLGIVWNKSGGASSGATYFQNYKQLGSGGFYFELYDTANISPSLAATPLIIDGSGNALFSKKLSSNNALSGIGYSTGAGGTVTQSTSKSTGVTINKVCGKITMSNESLAGSGVVSFTMTNSAIGANDTILITHISGGSAGAYTITPQSAAGSAVIAIRNVSFSSLGEAIVLQFSCVKSVIS